MMDVIEEETTLNGSRIQPEKLEEQRVKRVNDAVSHEVKDRKYRVQQCFELFRFATALDWLFMLLGAILAAAHGVAIPLMAYFFGEFIRAFIGQYATDNFLSPLTNPNITLLMFSPRSRGVLFNDASNSTNFCSDLFPAYNTTVTNAVELLSNGTSRLVCDYFLTANSTFNDILVKCYNEVDCLPNDEFFDLTNIQAIVFVCLAFGSFICGSLQVLFFEASSQRQVHKLRQSFYASILWQEIGWFDSSNTGELASRVIDDTLKIQEGIGKNLSLSIQWMSTFIGGLILGFITDWRVSLVVLGFTPFIAAAAAAGVQYEDNDFTSFVVLAFTLFIAAATAAGVQLRAYFTAREQDEYAAAGAVAEEAISAITTVVAFGGESKEAGRYDYRLDNANKLGAKRGVYIGLTGGLGYFVLLLAFAVGCWFAGYVVSKELITAYAVFVARESNRQKIVYLQSQSLSEDLEAKNSFLFSLVNGLLAHMILAVGPQPLIALPYGAFALGSSIKPLGAFATAVNVSKAIFDIIDTTPKTAATAKEMTPAEMSDSTIEFRNVGFTYPIRPDVQILHGLSLKVKVGQTVALVGCSGSGKSTVMQLLLKFYDVTSGQILVGNKDISSLDPVWLRENIGVVSQEPVLFDTTIANNIRLGKDDATMGDVIQAAKNANAHNFIKSLPDGYNTVVGEKGSQMSGGQKQRIAIARALVRNPKIMLLDEATSALDAESEAIVQEALDKVSKDRTTIIIAHRLSTIKNADLIISIKDGQVVEKGSHSELMDLKGVYYHLVSSQTAALDAGHHISGQTSTRRIKTKRTSRRMKTSYRGTSRRHPPLLRMDSQHSLTDLPGNLTRQPSVLSTYINGTKVSLMKHHDDIPKASFSKIMRLNSKEWWLVLLGVIGAIFNALLWPLFGLLLGYILNALASVPSEVLFKLHPPAGLMILLAIVSGVGYFIRTLCFSISGERLTTRVRSKTFQTILRQEMGWFDDKRNSTGVLTTILAQDAGYIQKATGRQIGVIVQTAVILIASVGISLYFSWVLTLVAIGLVPVLIASALGEALAFDYVASKLRVAAENSGEIIVESIANIRTVTAFNSQDYFQKLYQENLSVIRRNSLLGVILHGITFGLSSGALFIIFAVLVPFGAFQVTRPVDHIAYLPFQDIFKAALALGMAAVVVGKTTRFVPIYLAARTAAGRIFAVLDRKSLIDSAAKSGIQLNEIAGNIVAEELTFSYPTRPDDQILNGLSFSVQSGKTLALVGSSGCGKSTVMSLLLRFYDCSGELTLDGTEVKDLNLQWLRSQIGLVSQEPTLFDASIAENIRYGALFRDVSDDEVAEAAKQANIHNFIQSLPEGYNTNVGESGAQLSGGQKQRIAIARALIRNPKILLLDEATSALDTESERVVQEALDQAQEGRTSIVIAHRLSTIYGADCIAVIKNGRVVELGRHTALMKRRGVYYKLNRYQKVSLI